MQKITRWFWKKTGRVESIFVKTVEIRIILVTFLMTLSLLSRGRAILASFIVIGTNVILQSELCNVLIILNVVFHRRIAFVGSDYRLSSYI